MTRLSRKNLMVDEDKVRALARRRGVSESAAVREAVDVALLAEELADAMRELSALGGIDDVFGKMPVESEQGSVERRRADG